MKLLITAFIALAVLPVGFVKQAGKLRPSQADSLLYISPQAAKGEDAREAVKQAVLDYVEALYEADSSRIERSVHPDLFKLGFEPDKTGTYKSDRMAYQQLYDLAGRWNKSGKLPKDSRKEVVVFDVNDQTAAAKLTAVWGIDYIHLAKFEGKWKITDILWQTPARRP